MNKEEIELFKELFTKLTESIDNIYTVIKDVSDSIDTLGKYLKNIVENGRGVRY